MSEKAIELIKRNIDHINMILDNADFNPKDTTEERLKNISDGLDQALAALEQPAIKPDETSKKAFEITKDVTTTNEQSLQEVESGDYEKPAICKTYEEKAIKEAMEAIEQRKQGRHKLVYDKLSRTIIAVPNPNYLPDCKPAVCKLCEDSGRVSYHNNNPYPVHDTTKPSEPCPRCKPPTGQEAGKLVRMDIDNMSWHNPEQETIDRIFLHIRSCYAHIDRLARELEDIKLELSTPETMICAQKKEPLYKWAATIVCRKIELETVLRKISSGTYSVERCIEMAKDARKEK